MTDSRIPPTTAQASSSYNPDRELQGIVNKEQVFSPVAFNEDKTSAAFYFKYEDKNKKIKIIRITVDEKGKVDPENIPLKIIFDPEKKVFSASNCREDIGKISRELDYKYNFNLTIDFKNKAISKDFLFQYYCRNTSVSGYLANDNTIISSFRPLPQKDPRK